MKRATRFAIEQGWKIVLSDFGLNPADVLTLAQLPKDLFARKDALITAPQYFKLWQALESIAGADDLPLRIGQSLSLETFSPAIFASICSSDLRKELAEHYLAKSSISSGEISFLLGFQDNNSFLRAFNAWTGSSPAAYRRLS